MRRLNSASRSSSARSTANLCVTDNTVLALMPKKCKSQGVKKYCFTSYTRGIMAKGICGWPELDQGHLVSGRLLVSLALGVAARGKGVSANVQRREAGLRPRYEKCRGDSLLLLLGLVAEGVDAGTGTVAERVVRVLGLLLCGR